MGNLVGGKDDMLVMEERCTEHVAQRVVLLVECEDGSVGSARVLSPSELWLVVAEKEKFEAGERLRISGEMEKVGGVGLLYRSGAFMAVVGRE